MSVMPGSRVQATATVAPLEPIQRDVVCTILQDCVDQLEILGGIIPNDKPSALDAVRRRLAIELAFSPLPVTTSFCVVGDGRGVETDSGGPETARGAV